MFTPTYPGKRAAAFGLNPRDPPPLRVHYRHERPHEQKQRNGYGRRGNGDSESR